jgi:sugar lactone lactonase YvrE
LIPQVKTVTSIDFDWSSKTLYFADAFLGGIYATNLSEISNGGLRTLVKDEMKRPDSLAVEWVAKNLYFSDVAKKVIEVVRLDGGDRKIVIHADMNEPRSLAIHPGRG